MRESDERIARPRDGRPLFVRWQPRRSLSPEERYTGGRGVHPGLQKMDRIRVIGL